MRVTGGGDASGILRPAPPGGGKTLPSGCNVGAVQQRNKAAPKLAETGGILARSARWDAVHSLWTWQQRPDGSGARSALPSWPRVRSAER